MTGSVDVLIPCYNYGRFLDACVASVFDGARRPVRVLIADDASPDETPAVAAALARRYPDVCYVRHAVNIGHIATYNEGIRWARGDYFVLLSADDLVAPGSVERAAAFLDAHPDVGLVYGHTRMFHGEVPAVPQPLDCRSEVVDGVAFIRETFASTQNPIGSPASVMIRTTLQHEVGGYLPELPHAGDLEMYLRCAARAAVGRLDVDQGLYRKHGANMSRGFQHLRDYAQRADAFATIAASCQALLPDHEELLRQVRRTMALELFWTANSAFRRAEPAAAIDATLAFAASLDPSIRRRPCWRSLRVKRMLGPAWAERLDAAIDAVRRVDA